MALSVSMTGTGSIGNIAPGWSVSESINTPAIGDAGAGTGSVSFTAQSTDESLLVINNDTVSTVGNLGTVHGIVQSVSQTGLNTSVTHGTIADKFNLDCDVEPVEWGGLKGWLYNMYCAIGIQERQNHLPSIASAGASFPTNFSSMSSDYLYTFRSFIKDSFINIIDDVGGNGVVFNADAPSDSWIYDAYSTTSSFLPFMSSTQTGTYGSITPTNSIVLQIKTVVSQDNASRIYLGNSLGSANPAALSYSNCFTIDINGTALTATIKELNTATVEVVDLSAYELSQPILFTFQVKSSTYGMSVTMYVTEYDGTTVSTAPLFVNNARGTNWEIRKDSFEGSVFAINAFSTSITGDLTLSISYFDTEIPAPWADINFTNLNDFYPRNLGAFRATRGIAWELMQQLAAAEHFEFAISGDTLIARSIDNFPLLGSPAFDITNVGSSPTINPQSTLSGRQINVSYNNSAYINGVVYDAQADGNNVISVGAGEITVTSVKHNVDPIALRQPTRYLATGTGSGATFTGPLPDGAYFVSDSTGLPIAENQWEDFGGSVSVEIDPEDNSAIRITVVGPYTEIPSTTGPYALEANDGENSFAALKVLGTGVTVFQNELALTTGIDPDKYTRATINTINNPFIITQENAYDRGIWAAQKASGPVVSFSTTIPTSSISGVGLTCGSLIQYLDSTYRITSCSIGNLSTSINAERCVTVDDVDAIWGSQTVAQYDALWENYECQDQIIFPYKVA